MFVLNTTKNVERIIPSKAVEVMRFVSKTLIYSFTLIEILIFKLFSDAMTNLVNTAVQDAKFFTAPSIATNQKNTWNVRKIFTESA